MISHNVSEGIKPRNMIIAMGQGFLHPEAGIAAYDIGECVSGMPGSKSIAGHSTVHNGTWESHAVLEQSLQQAEEARRRYGSVAVGPAHSRGVGGVMPVEGLDPLEGVSDSTWRGDFENAIH